MFKLPSLKTCVFLLKNNLTPDEILFLTQWKGGFAVGVLLLDTMVLWTSEVSSHKLPRAQVRTLHMGEGGGQAYTALYI